MEKVVGEKVVCNGYPGTIKEVCEWDTDMVVVSLRSGEVCTSWYEIKRMAVQKAEVLKGYAQALADAKRLAEVMRDAHTPDATGKSNWTIDIDNLAEALEALTEDV